MTPMLKRRVSWIVGYHAMKGEDGGGSRPSSFFGWRGPRELKAKIPGVKKKDAQEIMERRMGPHEPNVPLEKTV
jgi:hypothetical protein